MLECYPPPYPDELYYSLWARAGARWRFPSRRTVSEMGFGRRFVAASIELPSHLARGQASLPPGHPSSVDQLIDDHTLLPLFAPFLPLERVQRLRADMRGDGGVRLYGRSGLKASRVPSPSCLRYCRHCVEEDRRRFGETYWRRSHQVVGVELCPQHGGALADARAHVARLHTSYEFIAAEDVVPHNSDLASHSVAVIAPADAPAAILRHPIFVSIAQGATWLLTQRNLAPGLHALQHRYHQVLTERDLTIRGGRIRMRDAMERFTQRVPVETQRRLGCELALHSADHWLARLLRAPRVAQHPLHHLLALYMLDISVADFFAPLLPSPTAPVAPVAQRVTSPFGAPPWPCLNPASDHYGEPRILRYEAAPLRSARGAAVLPPRARFACTWCGYVYIRAGPDRTAEDRFRCDQIHRYGPIWEQRLAQLWSTPAMSLRAVARRLRVDPLTIKRHAASADLPPRNDTRAQPRARPCKHDHTPRHARRLSPSDRGDAADTPADLQASAACVADAACEPPSALDRHAECRTIWSVAVATQAAEGAKCLRQQAPAVYMWLYRHDRAWLQAHTPPRRSVSPHSSGRVDWNERDQKLAQAVEEAAQRLRLRLGAPVRLSRSALARETGQSDVIFQQLGRLPQTAAIFTQVSESRIAFAVRRVQLAATRYLAEGDIPSRWRLERRAGIGRLTKVDAVARAVTAALEALSQGTAICPYPIVSDVGSCSTPATHRHDSSDG